MKSINTFNAVYCPGLLFPNQATVAAMGLLFEKTYLPNNIELIAEFSKKYRFIEKIPTKDSVRITPQSPDTKDPFQDLTLDQKATAYSALESCMRFSVHNHELFDTVFETNAFEGSGPLKVELIKEGKNGELNDYRVSREPLVLVGEENNSVTKLIQSGYIPVVGDINVFEPVDSAPSDTAKSLASLLAIKSVEMLFPATRPVEAEIILEARYKLKDQLPLFWSAMFELSKDLKVAIKECKTEKEVSAVGLDLVDTIVRPALTELNHKIELERKQWFRRVFGDVFRSLKIVAANPPITPEQLVKSSLSVGADAAMSTVNHLQGAQAIENKTGLAYLLNLNKLPD